MICFLEEKYNLWVYNGLVPGRRGECFLPVMEKSGNYGGKEENREYLRTNSRQPAAKDVG
ncbi:MAG TPA: hypothetical protein DCF49_00365 [Lachnospiraceae bacterium]|nr:hypothetical protein [Lachnospiraceae bacterium]